MSKLKAQERHAKYRAKQRYGLDLTKEIQAQIIQKIQLSGGKNAEVEFLCRQSCRVSLWKVMFNGVWMNVVYDSKRHSIATVLPEVLRENYIENKNINNFVVNGSEKPKVHQDDLTMGGFLPEHWTK